MLSIIIHFQLICREPAINQGSLRFMESLGYLQAMAEWYAGALGTSDH